LSFRLKGVEELADCLRNFRQTYNEAYKTIVVTIFSSDDRVESIKKMRADVAEILPSAVLFGCTSSGEIVGGHLVLESILVSFLIFAESEAEVVFVDCHDRTADEAGQIVMHRIDLASNLAGVGLLATLKTFTGIRDFNDKLKKIPLSVPVFGGSADSYVDKTDYINNEAYTCIFTADKMTDLGVMAILFSGKNLHITTCSYHGWKPLGSASVVTGMEDSTKVLTINDRPAINTYEKYLGISTNTDFFVSIMSFPLILERDGRDIARIPIGFDDGGAVTFGGDFYLGENVRLGYGDPNSMIADARNAQAELAGFKPEGILIFSCIVRRMYLHNDVNMELPLYENVAPSVGFYTYGELQRFPGHNRIHLLNGALIAVGMREGDLPEGFAPSSKLTHSETEFKDERISLIKGLANFVTVMAKELSEANAKLSRLADSDRLTELLNRGAIELIFNKELEKLNANGGRLSAIMLDIDHFKRINDNHGHEMGDQVLKDLAAILRDQTRTVDYVGRWGGEEFVIVLPGCSILQAVSVAERIRLTLPSKVILPDGTRVTASFGVTGAKPGDALDEVYKTLDKQLYFSKEHGRNKVSVAVMRQ